MKENNQRPAEQKKDKEANDSNLSSNASNEPTPIYLNEDSTLQSPEEDRQDRSIESRRNSKMEPSNDNLHDAGNIPRVGNEEQELDE